MKIVTISDIHGNLDALLALPESGGELWVLGDFVSYGPEPGPVIDHHKSAAAFVATTAIRLDTTKTRDAVRAFARWRRPLAATQGRCIAPSGNRSCAVCRFEPMLSDEARYALWENGTATLESCPYATVVSHRSGQTDDATIADSTVASGAEQIKSGSVCRCERVAKYGHSLAIEKKLGLGGHHTGREVHERWRPVPGSAS
jgi:Enolase, C-terminal TIM barrel domain